MKEIREVKLVEQVSVKFVADDGKEFIGENAERDCRDYERTRDEAQVIKEFERLDVKEISIPTAEWWYGSDYDAWKITLYSKRDYIAFIDYMYKVRGIWEGQGNPILEEPKEYPYTTVVGAGYDWAYEYPIEAIKEDLQKTLEQLG